MTGRTVTARELLDIRDRQWRGRLQQVSLITELDDIPPEHATQAVEALGRMYDRVAHDAGEALRTLQRWPAAHVVGMTGAAAVGYERGRFWGPLWETAGCGGGQIDQQRWGRAFLDNLDTLGLPAFRDAEDAGTPYVGRILMHAGIPTYCLGDFYRLLVERRRIIADLEAESLIAWAAERAGRRANIDKPVSRFLVYGGSYAVDLVDRSFELLDRLAAKATVDDFTLLPRRFVDYAEQQVAAGLLDPAPRRLSRTGSTPPSGQPHLALDPWGGGVMVALPAVGDMPDGSATWLVTIDGDAELVTSRPMWPGAAELAPETSHALRRPARDIVVSLHGYERHEYALAVLDEQRPLLAFDEDGRAVPPGIPLPCAPVWLVRQQDSQLTGEGDCPLLATGQLPQGWVGWTAELRDLTNATAITLDERYRRAVRQVKSVRIAPGEPTPGWRTAYGTTVYSQPPRVELPAAPADGLTWQITVTRVGNTQPDARCDGRTADELDSVWEQMPRPLLGAFEVTVRGALGRGARRRLFLAEGLTATVEPTWRRFQGGGLTPASVQAGGPPGLTVDPASSRLGPQDVRAFVTVHAADETEPLTIEPAHMTVAFESAARRTEPSISPVPLVLEELAEQPGALIVDLQGDGEPQLHLLAGGEVAQRIPPTGAAVQGRYRFDLARGLDTLRTHHTARLALDPDGLTTVATVRPRRLATAAAIEGTELVLADCPDIPGLTAGVYPVRAPWLPPAVLTVTGGRAPLPAELHDAGPLLVSLRIDDPWAPEPWPDWPKPGASLRADADGWYRGSDTQATQLSAYLAGHAEIPPYPRNLLPLWFVLERLPALQLQGRITTVADEICTVLRRDAAHALLQLGDAGWSRAQTVQATVRSGLAWAETRPPEPADLTSLWLRHPVLAALTGTSVLPRVPADPSGPLADLVEAALEAGGAPMAPLLAGHGDPCADSGRFDRTVDHLALMPPEAAAVALAATNLVPVGLLHVDSRAQAAMRLFHSRDAEQLSYITRFGQRYVTELRMLIDRAEIPAASDGLRAREHPDGRTGWRQLPAVSLGLALLARLAARGDRAAAGWLAGAQRSWTDLATVAPDIVAVDLVLAEALLTGQERAALQRENP